MKTLLAFALLVLISLAAVRSAEDPAEHPLPLRRRQRADTIAALGNPIIKTPNLDRLVHSGVSFRRAYMQGGIERRDLRAFARDAALGQNLFHIDEKLLRAETWPEAFARAGYTTFISGKWHNGDASLVRSFQIARSMFTGGMTNPMQAKLRDVADGKVGEAHLSPKHACEVFADEAIRFLKEHKDAPTPFIRSSLRAVRCAARSAHRAAGFSGRLRPGEDPAAAELPAAASVGQRRDDGPRRSAPPVAAPAGAGARDDRRILPLHLVSRRADRPHARRARRVAVREEHDRRLHRRHRRRARQPRPDRQAEPLRVDSVRVPLIIGGPGMPADQRTDAHVLPLRRAADARQAVRRRRPEDERRHRLHRHAARPRQARAAEPRSSPTRACSAPSATTAGS